MDGDRDDPLNSAHFDDNALEDYVLDQLLPDREAAIRQHLEHCVRCRAKVATYRAACRQISTALNDSLGRSQPSPALNFDQIARAWRSPRRSFNLRYHLRAIVPALLPGLVAVLLLVSVTAAFPSAEAVALRRLALVQDYAGPPAVIVAATRDGLTLVRAEPGQAAEVVTRVDYAQAPRNLRLSPTGAWLAFQEGHTLHVMQTVAAGAHAMFPVADLADWNWSPDGAYLAYTDGEGQLAVIDIARQQAQVLVPAAESAWGSPVWSADGQQIAFAVAVPLPLAGGPAQRQSVWRVDAQTGFRVEVMRNPTPERALWMPAAWATGGGILAWDVAGAARHGAPALLWIDTATHVTEPVAGRVLAHGMQLVWPVSTTQNILVVDRGRLQVLSLETAARETLTALTPLPQMVEWAPNGAWLAYVGGSAPPGEGLYLFALGDHTLRQVTLPPSAAEKALWWAGAEHLFVLRQPQGTEDCELWLVPLTQDSSPQRILSGVSLPTAEHSNGWRWRDVLTVRALTP